MSVPPVSVPASVDLSGSHSEGAVSTSADETHQLPTPKAPLGGYAFYWPELDGLRALAFFLVFTFHCWFINPDNKSDVVSSLYNKFSSWGFLGVDLFFVLSGFLITTILLNEKKKTGSISLSAFYVRRALRILPLYWLVMLIACVVVPLASIRHLDKSLYSQAAVQVFLPSALMVMNFTSHYTTDLLKAFSQAVHFPLLQLLNPLWSVCIEEHFYLFWPLAIKRTTGTASLLKVATLVAVSSFLISLGLGFVVSHNASGPFSSPDLYYANTFARAYSLLTGALLAIGHCHYQKNWSQLKSKSSWIAGAAILGFVLLVFGTNADFKSAAMPVQLFASALLSAAMLFSVMEQSVLKRIFSWTPLVVVGRLTYGMYLIHYPMIEIVGRSIKKIVGESWGYTGFSLKFSISLILTFGLAKLVFWLIESRALALRKRFIRA